MGGASSKVARKLPTRAAKPAWAETRTSPSGGLIEPRSPLASETRNEAIERDARDPQFISNLNRLGPVRVDHHMQSVKPPANTSRILKLRAESEDAASNFRTSHNHLQASSLSFLLDARKQAGSRSDLDRLAQQYRIDMEKLERVSRFINTPSIQADRIVRTVGKDGQENVTTTAIWVDPS